MSANKSGNRSTETRTSTRPSSNPKQTGGEKRNYSVPSRTTESNQTPPPKK